MATGTIKVLEWAFYVSAQVAYQVDESRRRLGYVKWIDSRLWRLHFMVGDRLCAALDRQFPASR